MTLAMRREKEGPGSGTTINSRTKRACVLRGICGSVVLSFTVDYFTKMTDALSADSLSFKETTLSEYSQTLVHSFRKTTRFYACFHIIFALLAFAEFFALAVFFSFWIASSTIAFLLAAIFLTGFSYFVLLFYFQVKKPQQLLEFRRIYLEACRSVLMAQTEMSMYHLSVAHAIYRTTEALDCMECDYYRLPVNWPTLQTLLRKFSIFCHWKDVLLMKELLLQEAINEHIALIKEEPVDLEAHASLGESYTRLAAIYQNPSQRASEEEAKDLFPWISPEFSSDGMQKKWRLAYARAIEEFLIIDAFAPNDPWVHAQLAGIYHELGEPKKESEEYETILRIVPEDKAALFKLGVLYFQEGHTAKGLEIYQKLKQARDPYSEKLLEFYDAFQA